MAKRKATWIERGIRRITLPVSGDVRYRVQLGGRGAGNRRSRLCKTLEEAKALRDEWVTRGLPAKNAPPISSKHDVVATEDDGFRQRVLGLEQRGKGSAATERVRVFLKNHWPTGAALPLHAVTVTTIEEYKERRFQIPTKRRQDRCAANTVIRKLREWRAMLKKAVPDLKSAGRQCDPANQATPQANVPHSTLHEDREHSMMRRARRVTLLVAFYLLTSAATASAECAWVLWEQINAEPWSLKDGFSDADSCKRALRSGIRKSVSRYPGSEDSGSNTAVIAKESGRLTLTFACLPDTVDPRGPKTK